MWDVKRKEAPGDLAIISAFLFLYWIHIKKEKKGKGAGQMSREILLVSEPGRVDQYSWGKGRKSLPVIFLSRLWNKSLTLHGKEHQTLVLSALVKAHGS